ncbi:MAG: flagellar motor protein PomA [Pseudomonadales bacterium]|nr:flagellar motor protein PomA [Pseudomonadales bacterium]
MDLATLLGMFGAIAVLIWAVVAGGSSDIFVNVPSVLIVLCGTLLIVLIKFNMAQALRAVVVAKRAFINKLGTPDELIAQIMEIGTVARREGLLALENIEVESEFLQRGINLLVDGAEPDAIKTTLERDLRETAERHRWGAKVFSALGEVAPAMGMIGTLIGLVQMLSSMDDPKQIGPAMAVALLTTLYGAVLANVVALPIADKLALRKTEEAKLNAICIDGVLGIAGGENPRVLESMLKIYLAPKERDREKGEEDEKPKLKSVA